jgi:hypothetical protein
MLLAGCGGGGNSVGSPKSPSVAVFSSTPPKAASEGSAYTYQLAASDSAGGSVTFALTAAPTGRDTQWKLCFLDANFGTIPHLEQLHGDGDHQRRGISNPVMGSDADWHGARQLWVDNYWNEAGSRAVAFNWAPRTEPLRRGARPATRWLVSNSFWFGSEWSFQYPKCSGWLLLAGDLTQRHLLDKQQQLRHGP